MAALHPQQHHNELSHHTDDVTHGSASTSAAAWRSQQHGQNPPESDKIVDRAKGWMSEPMVLVAESMVQTHKHRTRSLIGP
jgi:hypothetical protein